MGIYDVDDYLDRAKAFIAAGDENSLRHACLEMRFSLEHIVYQRLGQIGDELPRSIYNAWQPQKALKLLVSFEPRADQDVTLDICIESVDGEPSGDWKRIGDYKMFNVKWLGTAYNKLGSFLHIPTLKDSESPSKIKASDLQKIYDEIERVSTASVVMSMNSIAVAHCTLCKSKMYVSISQIEEGAVVECYNESCKAKHNITKINDDRFTADRIGFKSVPCKKCGERFTMETTKHGALKDCWNCRQTHVLGWGYGVWPNESSSDIPDEASAEE